MSLVDYVYIQSQIADLLRKCKCTKISVVDVEGVEVDATQTNTFQTLEDGSVYFVACDGTEVLISAGGFIGLTEEAPTEEPEDGVILRLIQSTGVLYLWNGSDWVVITPQSGQGITAGSPINLGDDSESDSAPGRLTSQRFINHNGFSIAHAGNERVAANVTGGSIIDKLLDPQTGSTLSWNRGVRSVDNAGSSTNNFTFFHGFNLTEGLTRIDPAHVGWGESWEFRYEPTAGDIFVEKHIIYVDMSDVQYRLESYTIDTGDLTTWEKYHTVALQYLKDPSNGNPFHYIRRNSATSSTFQLLASGSQEGLSIAVDKGATNVQLTHNFSTGSPNRDLLLTAWDHVSLPSFTSYTVGGGNYNTAVKNLLSSADNDCELGIDGFRFKIYRGCAIDVSDPAAFANKFFEVSNTGVTTIKRGYLTTSSAASLSLSTAGVYVFTGTTTTASLPTVAASLIGQQFRIKNRGSGNVTVDVTGGASTIYDTSAVASLVIAAGGYRDFILDGTYWVAM